MDPSPTPPRRFSHWKTTKRTFTFGKLVGNKPKTIKSPNKSAKNSDYISNKSLQKIQESSVNEAKDEIRQSLNNSKKSLLLKSSDTKKKNLRSDERNLRLEKSSELDREDSTETSSVDKENKDGSQDKQKRRNRKVKTITVSLTSQSETSKRKHSVEGSVIPSEKPKTLHTQQGCDEHNSESSDSESEGSQAKRIKQNKNANTQSQDSSNASNRSTNSANKTTNAVNKSTNAVNKSTNVVNKSANVVNKSTNAANESTNAVNKSTNAVNKSTNAVNRSNNATIRSTNSSNGSHNSSSPEKKKNVSTELKRLSSPLISSDKTEDSSSRPGLRNRSLLLSSQVMKEKRQYPLSYYYSSNKLSDKSSDSSTSMSIGPEMSKTKKVDLLKGKNTISKSNDTISKSKDSISKSSDNISNSKNNISKSNEEKHDQINSDRRQKKMSVPCEMIQLSKKGQLLDNKSTNLKNISPRTSEDDFVGQTEKHASRKTKSLYQDELDNESLNKHNFTKSKRQSRKPQETSGESSCSDLKSECKKRQSKRKVESANQFLPKNHHSAVKKHKSDRAHKAVSERETISADIHSSLLSPSNHSNRTSHLLKSRPAGLRKSILLSPPESKQYPISYYYSSRHHKNSDKETLEPSGPTRSGQTALGAREGPAHPQKSSRPIAEVNLPTKHKKPEPKSRYLKASTVLSSDSAVIFDKSMANVYSEQEFDLDIIAPEPQVASKEVTKKKGASKRVAPVKSSRAKVKASLPMNQDITQNVTVLASQVHQRKRNLAKEFDAAHEDDDDSQQSKKGPIREVHVWCEDGRSRPGSDVTAYDVLLENLETMEQQLKEDELDTNSQRMIAKVMNDLRSQIESLLLKRLDIKGLERDIRQVKARCGKLKENISKKQKENYELSSRMQAIHEQSKDVNLLLASCWMKDYAKLMEALDSQSG